MKTDLRTMCKKIGFVFLILGFFTIVETVVSKGTVQSHSQIQPVETPVKEVISQPAFEQSTQLPQGKLSVEEIHAISESNDGQIKHSISITLPATDKFTQSQAHMSVPEVKKLI